mgnify:CR=1 FL=1
MKKLIISGETVVSIRAPAWGATREGGAKEEQLRVSIRAPAWGATLVYREGTDQHPVSIRAPAWGATRL